MLQRTILICTILASVFVIGCNKKETISEAQLQLLRELVDNTFSHQASGNNTTNNADTIADGLKPEQPTKLKAKTTINAPVGKLFTISKADTLQVLGARLFVPAGSLERNRTLSITALGTDEIPQLPSGMVNVTKGAAGFRFLPHGEHFKKAAATVVIPFDTTLIPLGYTTKDIRTYYYNELHQQWTALAIDTISVNDAMVCALTTHFTDMINGIIQVPESPETQGYAPTSITDIKAANPATGIMAMAPPSASQSGAATMSYPFNLPAGRKGMQPSLALQYSSEAQSGWVGYGWSLSIPAIDIETRWGVPLFDANTETESYLVMGEQLTDQAHRTPGVARIANKQFYPSIEGGFSKIIRHGDSPKNYWWEMTDKGGTKHFFGGRNNLLDENAIVRNTDGNIVHWALTETRNVYNDFVSYTYELAGGMLYATKINYTGKGAETGLHTVEIIRYPEADVTRKDQSTSARLGILQYNNQQLKEVRIFYKEELLRSYLLNYEEGAFAKNMLTGVTEKNSDGADFNTHTFDYYNDVENGLYGPQQTWHAGNDQLNSFFNDKEDFKSNMSAINGAYSSGNQLGGGVSVGVGWGVFTASGGFSLEFTKNKSDGKITLMDINGDGLPDKVFVDDNELWYRPNVSNKKDGAELFGDAHRLQGINAFSFTESNSSSFNLNTGIGVNVGAKENFGIGAGASFDKAKSTEKTKIYFSDFNGDGLPDVANNGKVYFNFIGDDGHPRFLPTSAPTPNPIASTDVSLLDADFAPNYEAERDSLEKEYPLQDAVRIWRAPYAGRVVVTGNIELSATAIQWQEYDGSPDGIIASVQQEKSLLWKDSIMTAGEMLNPSLSPFNIKAGDRLLFRLQSRYSGALDEVTWSPEIKYDTIFSAIDPIDEHNINRYDYSAKDDFIFGGRPLIFLSQSGLVKVDLPYIKKPTSDDITLVVRKQSSLTKNTTEIFRETLGASDEIENLTSTLSINILPNDTVQLRFSIESKVQINWDAIRWAPSAQYLDGKTAKLFAAPEMNMFNKLIVPAKADTIKTASIVEVDVDTLYLPSFKIVPFLEMQFQETDTELNDVSFALRHDNSIIHFSRHALVGNMLVGDTLALDSIYENQKVFASFYASAELQGASSAGFKVFREKVITVIDSIPNPADTLKKIAVERRDTVAVFIHDLPASVHSVYNTLELGHLYKGWGQVGWQGEANKPIDVAKLKYDRNKYNQITEENAGNASDMEGILGDGEPMFTMTFDPEKEYYHSVTHDVRINGTIQSSSRIGELEIVVDTIGFPTNGSGLAAPVQVTRSTTKTVSAYGSIAGANASYSNSKVEGWSEMSAIDLNGDRYPDWIMESGGKVKSQYTANSGALSAMAPVHNFGVTTNTGEANSFSGGFGSGASKVVGGFYKKRGEGNSRKAVIGTRETAMSMSISGNVSTNKDHARNEWIDVNGDGLPDMAFENGDVMYNTGYGFTEAQKFGHSAIHKNTSNTVGGGGGISIPITGYASIGFGVSFSSNTTDNDFQITDINGDGLPDMVKDGQVAYNLGTGFSPFTSWKDGLMTRSKSSSTAINANIAFPIMFPVWLLTITITPSIVYAHTEGVSRTLSQIMDINGDGYPDLVESDNNSELKVRLNQMGRTNLLKTVHRPYGATITLDYNSKGNTYDLPQSKTVLARVDVQTNMPENGATRLSNTFDYQDGYYDRYERDFFGFAKVITRQLDTQNDDLVYRTVTQTYGNRSFITKNLLQNQVLTDANDNALNTTVNNYELVAQPHDAKSKFPALKQTVSETREPNSAEVLRTSETFDYDAVGNVTKYISSVSGDEITSNIAYHTLAEKRILNVPKSISVATNNGEMRRRETSVDDLGNITQIRQHNSDYVAKYDMTYDTHGNLTRITRPENYKGERMWYAYTYDDVLNMLVTSVTDAFGYSSSTQYDYKWAAPIETLDLNGNRMVFTYDNHGRMSTVTAPYELDAGHPYTIAFDYVTDASVPYARTSHFDAHTGGNIETYTFVDALMRPVQVKKTSVVYNNGADEQVITVSGRVKYDAFGRATQAYLPTVEPLANATSYSTATDNVAPTISEYDVQDRTVKVTLPDGATTTSAFALVPHMGQTMMQTTITDALGRSASSFTDGRGRTRTTLQQTDGNDVRVSYQYNLIGELLEVTHPNSHKTTYTYDKLGRKLSVNHPDAGLTTFEYDQANNLRRKQTPNLRKAIQDGGYINYEYNFERLHEILYPKNIYNRVTYTYGDPGDEHNRAGRLTLVEDGSGGEAYYYGKMGEVTKTVKTIMLSLTDIRTYVWAAQYDSWNRVQNMTYPDGEKVTYLYNAAGNLQSMTAQKDDDAYLFIAHQGYDKYGQLTYRKAGNGTETTYDYDPIRQRLLNMTLMAKGSELMNNTYSYDAVDNILGITNTATPQGDIGGAYAHTYQYDDLNRLVTAAGNGKGADYALNMSYDVMGNPLKKEQTVNGSSVASSHTFTYLYEGTKPNAASMIGNQRYTYDENGNPLMREDTATNAFRQMLWDEENRLAMLSDDGYTSRYTYNHGGERVIKSHGGTTGVYIDGNPQGILYHDADNYTAYVSPYMVVSKDRFTKHYYTGTQRVASKIGVGKFNNLYIQGSSNITAGQKDYAARMALIEQGRADYYAQLGIPPGPPTSKGIFGEPEYAGKALPNDVLGNYDIPANWPRPPVKNKPGDVPGPPVMYAPPVNPQAVEPGYGYTLPVPLTEDDIYFYHTDHLGSTSYVTDADAKPTQFVCYMPFGQAFVDEHTTRAEMPFKFNGKEQDAETGLYYFGARYYDPMIALWYEVDPLAEKAPGWSPYRAFFNNPVRFIDPDGLFETEASAMAYQKGNNIPGNISQGSDGIWNIDDTKSGTSYFKDASLDGIENMAGRGDDGVITSVLVTADRIGASGGGVNYNDQYAGAVEKLAGKPYVLGADGPKAYDCSSTACYGIRTVANSKFGDYTAHDLFKKFSVPSTSKTRGSVIFYDYKSDGRIDHITTILNSSNMLHPSSGAGVLQIKPINFLDSYTKNRGGTIYYREFNWLIINKTP